MASGQDPNHDVAKGEEPRDDDLERKDSDKSAETDETDRTSTSDDDPVLQGVAAPYIGTASDLEPQEDGRGRSVVSRHSRSSSLDSQRTVSDHGGHDHQMPPHRTASRPRSHRSRAQSSVRSIAREAIKVPIGQRRGLLARFSLIAEVNDPYAYSRRMKWMLTFVVAIAGAAAPMGSSIVLPALKDIERDLHTTPTIVNLSVALWMISMSIFPLWWSSFSESLGRRSIYIVSFALYFLFNILAAVSTSITMFLVMRVLAAGGAASVQAVGAGSIADFWEVKERGRAMGIFYLGPLCGPLIAPIIGGVMAQGLGWRSVQWFLGIFGALIWLLILFALPETLRQRRNVVATAEQEATAQVEAHVIEKTEAQETGAGASGPVLTTTTTKQSVEITTKKYLKVLRRCLVDPLRILFYAKFPAVAICVAYGSITFTVLYMLNISVQQTFSVAPYNYSSTVIGLLYIPNSLGYFLSSVFGGKWVDQIMHREARKAGRYDEKGRLVFRPEDRMKENAWLGAILYPAALIMYGWTAEYGVNVAVPLVANFIFGVGSMIIFALATTMLTEFMPRKASSGVALNNFVRNILGCIGTVVTQPILVGIGNGWLFTILGLIALVGGCLTIWIMKRYGDHWRIKMDRDLAEMMDH